VAYAARESLCVCACWLVLSGCRATAQASGGLQQPELVRLPLLSGAEITTPRETQSLPANPVCSFPSIDEATCIDCLSDIDGWSG
jgi:predicted component of type VI protein secretion system